MRIIKVGSKQMTCGKCETIFEYLISDTHEVQLHINEYARCVNCPVCNNEIRIN